MTLTPIHPDLEPYARAILELARLETETRAACIRRGPGARKFMDSQVRDVVAALGPVQDGRIPLSHRQRIFIESAERALRGYRQGRRIGRSGRADLESAVESLKEARRLARSRADAHARSLGLDLLPPIDTMMAADDPNAATVIRRTEDLFRRHGSLDGIDAARRASTPPEEDDP